MFLIALSSVLLLQGVLSNDEPLKVCTHKAEPKSCKDLSSEQCSSVPECSLDLFGKECGCRVLTAKSAWGAFSCSYGSYSCEQFNTPGVGATDECPHQNGACALKELTGAEKAAWQDFSFHVYRSGCSGPLPDSDDAKFGLCMDDRFCGFGSQPSEVKAALTDAQTKDICGNDSFGRPLVCCLPIRKPSQFVIAAPASALSKPYVDMKMPVKMFRHRNYFVGETVDFRLEAHESLAGVEVEAKLIHLEDETKVSYTDVITLPVELTDGKVVFEKQMTFLGDFGIEGEYRWQFFQKVAGEEGAEEVEEPIATFQGMESRRNSPDVVAAIGVAAPPCNRSVQEEYTDADLSLGGVCFQAEEQCQQLVESSDRATAFHWHAGKHCPGSFSCCVPNKGSLSSNFKDGGDTVLEASANTNVGSFVAAISVSVTIAATL